MITELNWVQSGIRVDYMIENATFTGTDGSTTTGTLEIERFDKPARLKRTISRTLKVLGITVLTVFIPIVHFFSIPAGLIAAVIVGFLSFKTEAVLISGSGTCPYCGK